MGKKKSTPAPAAVTPSGDSNPYSEVMSGYREFAQTGGFSPEDLANIRARSVSPIRAVYANAQRAVERQRALQGGYSPGFQAAMTKMAREQSYNQAESAVNREAEIAEMVQRGRLAGLGGMADIAGRGGGGGGGGVEQPEPKKVGFWGKLAKVGRVALPIALAAIPGGQIAAPLAAGAMAAGGAKRQSKAKGIGSAMVRMGQAATGVR